MIPVTVKERGKMHSLMLTKGVKLIQQFHKNKIMINDACEGNLGCGTCHVHLDEQTFKRLGKAGDEEEELLQLVPDLQPTSRLACGLTVDESLAGAVITIPQANRHLLPEHRV